MTQTGRRARVAHAIPGRLRIRFEGEGSDALLTGLGAVRFAPGVRAVEIKPAARSAIVRYDTVITTEAEIVAALQKAGVNLVLAEAEAISPPVGEASDASTDVESGGSAAPRDARGRFQGRRGEAAEPRPVGQAVRGQAADTKAEHQQAAAKGGNRGGRSELMEMLIGPPPKLDRRFAESLALSAVSLVTARQIGLALGGGSTLPAYFVIWFALRRLTGAGRRR